MDKDGAMVEQIARAIAGRANALNRADPARLDRLGQAQRARIMGDAVAAWEACRLSLTERLREGAAGLGILGRSVHFDEPTIDALIEYAASGIESSKAEAPKVIHDN